MKSIACSGDSNTWGYNPHTKERYSRNERWTGVLRQELGMDMRSSRVGKLTESAELFEGAQVKSSKFSQHQRHIANDHGCELLDTSRSMDFALKRGRVNHDLDKGKSNQVYR